MDYDDLTPEEKRELEKAQRPSLVEQGINTYNTGKDLKNIYERIRSSKEKNSKDIGKENNLDNKGLDDKDSLPNKELAKKETGKLASAKNATSKTAKNVANATTKSATTTGEMASIKAFATAHPAIFAVIVGIVFIFIFSIVASVISHNVIGSFSSKYSVPEVDLVTTYETNLPDDLCDKAVKENNERYLCNVESTDLDDNDEIFKKNIFTTLWNNIKIWAHNLGLLPDVTPQMADQIMNKRLNDKLAEIAHVRNTSIEKIKSFIHYGTIITTLIKGYDTQALKNPTDKDIIDIRIEKDPLEEEKRNYIELDNQNNISTAYPIGIVANMINAGILDVQGGNKDDVIKLLNNIVRHEEYRIYRWTKKEEIVNDKTVIKYYCALTNFNDYFPDYFKYYLFLRFAKVINDPRYKNGYVPTRYEELTNSLMAFRKSSRECTGEIIPNVSEDQIDKESLEKAKEYFRKIYDEQMYHIEEIFDVKIDTNISGNEEIEEPIINLDEKKFRYSDGWIYKRFPIYRKEFRKNNEEYTYEKINTPLEIEKYIEEIDSHKDIYNKILGYISGKSINFGGGGYGGNSDIVSIASAEISDANIGGKKYQNWYYGNDWQYADWCAIFVSWVANEAGYLITDDNPNGSILKFCNCGNGYGFFNDRGQLRTEDDYIPKPGDIIFFGTKNPVTKNPITYNHVGIVSRVEGNDLWSVEGNTGAADTDLDNDGISDIEYHYASHVEENPHYNFRNDPEILGYGTPAY